VFYWRIKLQHLGPHHTTRHCRSTRRTDTCHQPEIWHGRQCRTAM